jgi:alkylhydroperoxidase family enzyme
VIERHRAILLSENMKPGSNVRWTAFERLLLAAIASLAPPTAAHAGGAGREAIRIHPAGKDHKRTSETQPFVVVPDNAAAWTKLPAAEKGAGAPLPAWTRALAPTLPRTAAALLELDYLHRVKSPLDAPLRGKLRLAVAQANGCAAGEAEALADLRGAGLNEQALEVLVKTPENLPVADRQLREFARKLTLDSQAITDQDVTDLIERHGDRQVVAMVQHVAYANFQDRLLLGLGLANFGEAPPAPREFRFARPSFGATLAQPRSKPVRMAALSPASVTRDLVWPAATIDTLHAGIERQKARRPRIALTPGRHDAVVHWGEVCRTYQPKLARAWAYSMWVFGAEAFQDPVLEASVLWVVTRTQQSFY